MGLANPMCASLFVDRPHTHTHTPESAVFCTHVRAHVFAHIHARAHVHTPKNTLTCARKHTRTHIHTHTLAHTLQAATLEQQHLNALMMHAHRGAAVGRQPYPPPPLVNRPPPTYPPPHPLHAGILQRANGAPYVSGVCEMCVTCVRCVCVFVCVCVREMCVTCA